MVGLPFDCVMNPLGAVRSTFKEAFHSETDMDEIPDSDWGVRALFNDFLFHQDGLAKVPTLDRFNKVFFQSNTLVRFRGMIQDMLPNETYVGAYKDNSGWRTTKFADLAEVDLNYGMKMVTWDRHVFNCVSVPGLNSWAESNSEPLRNRLHEALQGRDKRKADAAMDIEDSVDQLEVSPNAKKMRESKDSSASTNQESSTTCSASVVPYIPENAVSCIVKIYDWPESDFKLNEVYDFIGIFTPDPENQYADDAFEEYFDSKAKNLHSAQLPPHVKVPHLHCIIHRKLGLEDFLLKPPFFKDPKPDVFTEVRVHLLEYFTRVLGGDKLAAEFMLLHLLSKVHRRTDPYVVGRFSLNLIGFNKESTLIFRTLIKGAINDLLPFSNYVPLNVEALNVASCAPIKDHNSNRLITGPLQVVDGTHLILDTTESEAVALNDVGSANVKSLLNLFKLQKVYYDFKVYQLEFLTDIKLLVLSKKMSELCPADIVLPFQPLRQGCVEVDPEYLDAFRWYLATVRSLPFTIDPQLEQIIGDDLARVKRSEWNLGCEDFNSLLTMSRLICTSYGETSLSWDHWKMVIRMETQRRQRLNLSNEIYN